MTNQTLWAQRALCGRDHNAVSPQCAYDAALPRLMTVGSERIVIGRERVEEDIEHVLE